MAKRAVAVENVFLSLTSLYRSPELQRQLRRKSHLVPQGISAHNAGAAIDFDPGGYYVGEGRKSVQRGNNDFNPAYTLALKSVLGDLASKSLCHVIWESGYRIREGGIRTYEACYHVCVSPNYETASQERDT